MSSKSKVKRESAAAEDNVASGTNSKRVKVTSKIDADESINMGATKAMAKAEALAISIMESIKSDNEKLKVGGTSSKRGGTSSKSNKERVPTEEEITSVLLAMGDHWPTQVRPNVSDSAVSGMCLGMVNAFTAGLRVSLASLRCPEVTKLLNAFILATLPDKNFKYSSLQINYNYAAKRHVDGNNMGASYIRSFGDHTGGDLWTADQGVITCHGKWVKFNGKAEHETEPFKGTRISFILFTHNACEELTPEVVEELKCLGFTAGDSCRLRDPGNVDENDFDAFYEKHRQEHPPPSGDGFVALECAGYACGRGAAWVSFDTGMATNSNKQKASIFMKTPPSSSDVVSAATIVPSAGSADWSTLTKQKQNKIKAYGVAGAKFSTEVIDKRVTVKNFPKNKVGLHVVELRLETNGTLQLENVRLFDLYNRTEQAHLEFAEWVNYLPEGTVVCVAISDTAIAKKRPMEESAYVAFRQLGASADMDVVGYRNPFIFLGAKGLAQGSAQFLLDKRAQSKTVLRLDAQVVRNAKGGIEFKNVKDSSINATQKCPDREKEGYIFKNCQRVVKDNGKLVKKKN